MTHGGTTVIVVAADSGPVLAECVAAALADDNVAELRLIDNASRDGVVESVARKHADDPRLHVTRSQRNLGFGAAVNRAAREATGDWLLILNPDVTLQPGDLTRLLQTAHGDSQAGLVGALMLDDDGIVDAASQRRDPELRRVLAHFGLAHGEGVTTTGGHADVLAVENVSGALMLVRREVFESLDGFDEGFFLHFEDLDLCRRVRDAGKRVLLDRSVRVTHHKGSSSRHRPLFVAWHKHRGMWRWFDKHDPLARRGFWRLVMRAAIAAHFVFVLPGNLWRAAAARLGASGR